MSKKATKVETINAIIEKYGVTGSDLEFLQHEIALLQKRSEYKFDKPTKKQTENEAIKVRLMDAIEDGKQYTATDLANACELSSAQKASALLKQLVDSGALIKGTINRRTYFGMPGTEFVKPTADDTEVAE